MSDNEKPATDESDGAVLLRAADYGAEAQIFLFGCALWLGSADKQLSVGEQRWLRAEFSDSYASLLQASLKFQGTGLPAYVEKSFAAVDENDRKSITPQLKVWLQAFALADSVFADAEREVLGEILKKLGI